MPRRICIEAELLYANRPAAIEEEAACIAPIEAVFLTSGALFSGMTTSWFVRTGRLTGVFEGTEEVSDFVLSVVAEGIGGWFVGRLEMVLTTRCRS